MKRSLIVIACFACALLPSLKAASAKETVKKPNILFLFVDDMGIGDLGCYNPNSKIPTPNIDQLAREGMRFSNAYVAAAVCVPSRYGLLTGRYPSRRKSLKWQVEPLIENDQMTLASLLKENDYHTGMVGKWHLGFEGGTKHPENPLVGGPVDRGFDSFFGQHGSLDQAPYFYIKNQSPTQQPTKTTPDTQEEAGKFSIIYQGRFWRKGKIAPDFVHEEVLDRYGDEACKFLNSQNNSKKPFFLYLALTAPHGPWLPGKEYRGKTDAGPLGDFVLHVDSVVGRVLNALHESGLEDDTLVFLTSDNGPLWFEPDVKRWKHDSSGGFRGRKGDVWEGGIRMPFIAKWPNRIPKNSISKEVVGTVDMLATFADIVDANLPNDAGPDSFSILPALLDSKLKKPIRESIILQSGNAKFKAVRKGPWKLIPFQGGGGFLPADGKRKGKKRNVKPDPNLPAGQLYNLEDDPAETNNLYAEKPELVKELMTILDEYRSSTQTR